MERPQRQLGLTERSFRSPLGKRLQGYWYVRTSINSFLCYLKKRKLSNLGENPTLLLNNYKKPNESLRYQKGTLPYEGMVPSMKGIEKEVKPKAPLQGNLGWAYMQQENHKAAEAVYQKAQIIDPDANKACNLSLCLMKQSRHSEARAVLEQVLHNKVGGSNDQKSRKRAEVLMKELEEAELANKLLMMGLSSGGSEDYDGDGFINQSVMNRSPLRSSRRLPIFEEISQFRDQLAC